MLLPKIVSVQALEKYKLRLLFNDNTSGIYDVSDLAGKGVFKEWEHDDHFFKVFIDEESGAISWPADLDIDSFNAYCSIKGVTPEEYFKGQVAHATN